MLPDKIAFVDLETTGARSTFDRIIEIGIVRVENNVITKTYNSLVDPQTHIPPEIERLTGITGKDIIGAPTFSHIKDDIMELLTDCVFVAHNVRFDYGFLKSELFREGITYTSKHFCTVRLSQILYPEYKRHNLDSIIERLQISCENRHRALDDAKVIATFYDHARSTLVDDIFTDAVNKAMKKPSVPINLQKADLDSLPEFPGVYKFYGDNDLPLYIGKSVNIKDRVLSHFSSDIHSPTEMKISQQIKRIETSVTAGELGALLLESKLIKEQLPLYNRQLRVKQQLVGLRILKDPDGYHLLRTETITAISPGDLQALTPEGNTGASGKILGFFRSTKQAKEFLSTIAKEHTLCEKLLGLEKTSTSCFGYRLDRCRGACLKKELAVFYNIRLLEALRSITIKPWPFEGPILIEERNELSEKIEYFLIDKWCYLGSTTTPDATYIANTEDGISFDLDVYKILRRYLMNPTNIKRVKTLSSNTTSDRSLHLGVMIS